jgi:hypothetical protein
MKLDCLPCDGTGVIEKECCECGTIKTVNCENCDGTGKLEQCLTEFLIPADHRQKDQLAAMQADARMVKIDHSRLCLLNPRAKESYDSQLAATLLRLNNLAEEIFQS